MLNGKNLLSVTKVIVICRQSSLISIIISYSARAQGSLAIKKKLWLKIALGLKDTYLANLIKFGLNF